MITNKDNRKKVQHVLLNKMPSLSNQTFMHPDIQQLVAQALAMSVNP